MSNRRKRNRRAEAVASDWLATRPTFQQVQEAREELGYHTFRDAVATHGRAERGVVEHRHRAAWFNEPLPFGDEIDGVS